MFWKGVGGGCCHLCHLPTLFQASRKIEKDHPLAPRRPYLRFYPCGESSHKTARSPALRTDLSVLSEAREDLKKGRLILRHQQTDIDCVKHQKRCSKKEARGDCKMAFGGRWRRLRLRWSLHLLKKNNHVSSTSIIHLVTLQFFFYAFQRTA